MDHMIATTSRVMSIAVTQRTVTYRVVSIIASTLGRETDRESCLVGRTAILILTYHRDLLHGMENVAELEIGMFAMNLIGTFDAKVKWWRTVGSIANTDAVVKANFCRLSIASIRALFALTYKGHHVICGRKERDCV